MVTVRFPSTLRIGPGDTIEVHEPVATIDALIDALDRRHPGLREQLDDSVFNFAVNGDMLLQHARHRALKAGDVVEIVPAIAGG